MLPLMATPNSAADREKLVSKLPAALKQSLKVRAAQLSTDVQDAVAAGIHAWRARPEPVPAVDTAGAESFGTYLPEGLYDDFKGDCRDRKVSYIQGLAQAVALWLVENPAAEARVTRRIIVCNQKGGVGKTSVAAGLAQALAEGGEHILKAALSAGLAEELAKALAEVGDSASCWSTTTLKATSPTSSASRPSLLERRAWSRTCSTASRLNTHCSTSPSP